MASEIEVLGVSKNHDRVNILAENVVLTFFLEEGELKYQSMAIEKIWDSHALDVPKETLALACRQAGAILRGSKKH